MNPEEYKYIEKFMELFYSIEESIINLKGLVDSNYKDFIDYVEKAPKPSEQWLEERLRALELQVKILMHDKKILEEMFPCDFKKTGASDG